MKCNWCHGTGGPVPPSGDPCSNCGGVGKLAERERIVEVTTELRAYRAALTPERVKALRWARDLVTVGNDMRSHQRHDPIVQEHLALCSSATDALDALIKLRGGE